MREFTQECSWSGQIFERAERIFERAVFVPNTIINTIFEMDLKSKKLQNDFEIQDQKASNENPSLECLRCDKTFLYKIAYSKHIKRHEIKDTEVGILCNTSMKDQSELEENDDTKEQLKKNRIECQICLKSFAHLSGLKSHGRIHNESRDFQCENCYKTFKRKGNLKQHSKTIHTGDRPFECKDCKKTFKLKSNLKKHSKIHTGEKPFKCENCSKSFPQQKNLQRHYRTHTGEKPFQCKTCNTTFSLSDHLKNHERIHVGEKHFQCKECNKTFTQQA